MNLFPTWVLVVEARSRPVGCANLEAEKLVATSALETFDETDGSRRLRRGPAMLHAAELKTGFREICIGAAEPMAATGRSVSSENGSSFLSRGNIEASGCFGMCNSQRHGTRSCRPECGESLGVVLRPVDKEGAVTQGLAKLGSLDVSSQVVSHASSPESRIRHKEAIATFMKRCQEYQRQAETEWPRGALDNLVEFIIEA